VRVWGLLRRSNCGITWSRDWNACWNIAWKGLCDLDLASFGILPDHYDPDQLFEGLTPRPDDIRRFKTRITETFDKNAKKDTTTTTPTTTSRY